MEKQTLYWFQESLESFDTAKVLFNNHKYLDSAFFCHLAMEKMLKAFLARKTGIHPPKIHNLILLAQRSGLDRELSESQKAFLAELNPFQIEGRYPGDRELLYRQTSKRVFEEIIQRTEVELKWYEQKLKSNK